MLISLSGLGFLRLELHVVVSVFLARAPVQRLDAQHLADGDGARSSDATLTLLAA